MFTSKKPNKDPRATTEPLNQTISLNLNGNNLLFTNGTWIVQSPDLETAADEINLIIDERDELTLSLKEVDLHTDALNKEIIETNDMKNVALGMVRRRMPHIFLFF
jgi:hypothetical protein